MKYLYFTRSNGDVDNYRVTNNKPASDIEKLSPSIRDEARRGFIGDLVENFQIIDTSAVQLLYPAWDGAQYVTGDLSPIWESERDKLESEAVILHDGNLILMDDRSRKGLNQAKDSLKRRSKSIKWKVQGSDGKMKRIDLTAELIEKFEDSIVDEIESLHIQADTQSPNNPWPVEVI